jgi:hypothetical protein
MVVLTCNSSNSGGGGGRILVIGQPTEKCGTLYEKEIKK